VIHHKSRSDRSPYCPPAVHLCKIAGAETEKAGILAEVDTLGAVNGVVGAWSGLNIQSSYAKACHDSLHVIAVAETGRVGIFPVSILWEV
jgi:hypothetical protein